MAHLRCKCKKYDAVSHGLCDMCIGAALVELSELHNEFDLRLVEGIGPEGVHVPTWEKMQPAVDSMGDTIAKLCADEAEATSRLFKAGSWDQQACLTVAARIRGKFKV